MAKFWFQFHNSVDGSGNPVNPVDENLYWIIIKVAGDNPDYYVYKNGNNWWSGQLAVQMSTVLHFSVMIQAKNDLKKSDPYPIEDMTYAQYLARYNNGTNTIFVERISDTGSGTGRSIIINSGMPFTGPRRPRPKQKPKSKPAKKVSSNKVATKKSVKKKAAKPKSPIKNNGVKKAAVKKPVAKKASKKIVSKNAAVKKSVTKKVVKKAAPKKKAPAKKKK